MKKRILALVLVMALLAGCQGTTAGWVEELASVAGYGSGKGVEEMVYTRPDMSTVETCLQNTRSALELAGNVDNVLAKVYAFYDFYDEFYTNSNLAYIHYCTDVTDTYWQEEYAFCSENSAAVDAGLEELYQLLAQSKWRDSLEEAFFGEDFFLSYDGEGIWDETFQKLMSEENALVNAYYEVYEESLEVEYYSEEYFTQYASQMAQLYVELIAKRQEIADWVGYDSYAALSYDMYYYRDYTPEAAEAYLKEVGRVLAPLYTSLPMETMWEGMYEYCTEEDTFAYVRDCATAMGGAIEKAFQMLQKKGLYDITFSEKKMDISFELYLYAYNSPFIFVSTYEDSYDKLTFAHEFGHFVNDYSCAGSYAGTDIAEVHSQGMEYLSLFYGTDTAALEKMKMADCLEIYVRQSALALFEHQVYELTGDELTVENVQALYERVSKEFGLDVFTWDPRDYVSIEHLFAQPMYLVSYVLSNDVAFQLYLKEREEAGEGLRIYRQCLMSEDSYIMAFAKQYGFEDPFAPGRLETVRDTLKELLQ